MLKEYWTYDELMMMPLKGLFAQIDYFAPKLREIARQQEAARIKAEMEGKQQLKKPGGVKR